MTTVSSDRVLFPTRLLQAGLMAVILATVVPYGAVHPIWFYLAALLNGVVFVGTLALPFRNLELLRVYRAALVILVLVIIYLLFQSFSLPRNAFENSIWNTVRHLLNVDSGAISVNPDQTRASIPQIIHPFLIFMAGLVLHQSTDAALLFWRRLAFIGTGVAVCGIAQNLLFPDTLLLGPKMHYIGSVTGTFVNRNSAATFFGITALLLTALLVRQFYEFAEARDQPDATERTSRSHAQKILLIYLGLFFVVLLAEFLTRSRGGLVSTFIPLFLLAAWFGYSFASPETPLRLRLGLASASVAAVVMVFAILGARALLRIEQAGTEDYRLCVFDSTLSAIVNNPWLGTGFGTFEQVFPAYRIPECGISGLWDRAHNFFLEGYLGMGLPFAVLVLFVLVYLILIFSTGYRRRRRFRIFPLVGIGVLLLVTLHGMVDFSLQIPGVNAFVAATLSAAVAVSLSRVPSSREATVDVRSQLRHDLTAAS
jgi:O-antigen ligase